MGSVVEGLTMTIFVWLFPIIVVLLVVVLLVGWVLLVLVAEPGVAHTPLGFNIYPCVHYWHLFY